MYIYALIYIVRPCKKHFGTMDLNQVDIEKLPADVRKTFKQLQVLHAEKDTE